MINKWKTHHEFMTKINKNKIKIKKIAIKYKFKIDTTHFDSLYFKSKEDKNTIVYINSNGDFTINFLTKKRTLKEFDCFVNSLKNASELRKEMIILLSK